MPSNLVADAGNWLARMSSLMLLLSFRGSFLCGRTLAFPLLSHWYLSCHLLKPSWTHKSQREPSSQPQNGFVPTESDLNYDREVQECLRLFLLTRKRKAIYLNSNLNDIKPLPSTIRNFKGFRNPVGILILYKTWFSLSSNVFGQ